MQESNLVCGQVFDIQRFSVHDGKGIRTTVFLKGCPLRCVWCQNPEGISRTRGIIWTDSSCIGCGQCAQLSTDGGAIMQNGKPVIHRQANEDWEKLVDACPAGALRFDSECLSVEQVMERVRRDKPFYANGEGGVTLSGGDPLQQSAFALAVLKACKSEGIPTAMETELCAPWRKVEQMLPYLDQLYVDIKIANDEKMKDATGVCAKLILENVRHLLESPYAHITTVRTPLIPGYTASEQNIRDIARFLIQIDPGVSWELLNYNPLAAAKYPLIGKTYTLDEVKPLSKDDIVHLVDIARQAGATGAHADL